MNKEKFMNETSICDNYKRFLYTTKTKIISFKQAHTQQIFYL